MILNPVGYIREPTEVRFGRYGNGQTAIFTVDANGLPAVKLTVCLDPEPTYEGKTLRSGDEYVWIKTWSENAGVLEQALADGILARQVARVEVNDWGSGAVLCQLSPAALADLRAQQA